MPFASPLWAEADEVWHLVLTGLALVLSAVASAHVILYKRDSRAAIGWLGCVWLMPLAGALLYFVFGVNRIRRRASSLRADLDRYRALAAEAACLPEELHRHLPAEARHLEMLARVVEGVVERPLLPGNRVEALVNGDAAFPAMLEAIGQARASVALETYIFDRDEAGLAFAQALGQAVRRGVEVRVLVDAAGARYSWPSILGALRRQGVRHARFLPSFNPYHLMSLNLRTHRKLLVTDGRRGFTGGMNIRAANCLERRPRRAVQDLQFQVQGPVVAHLQETFADDWRFTTGEVLRGEAWFPKLERSGPVLARGVTDGPDEDYQKLRWTLLGALSIARQSVRVLTPYFLPDAEVVCGLNLAAMRGVAVDLLLPARNNLPFVQWASRAMWWQVLKHGCRLWLTPPPFDHSKLMLLDGCWVLLGSANWDARSLRLNFEFDVECYDPELAARLELLVEAKRRAARQVTLEQVDGRPFPIRLRDGLARLLTPYL
ncbi:MAG TPA: phospholipase D-like domain-containing protein [Dongiaceae bacterium]|nr:phospholipase D-like domain-containing protein [Dongiaceae bacterium]